jgi:ribosome-binding protein aMBF1 (putative translation factor)
MHGNPQRAATFRAHELRREGGKWLKEKREQANLSQRQLAAKVGAEYYTLISQLETGRGRVAIRSVSRLVGSPRCAARRVCSRHVAVLRSSDLRHPV